MAGQRKDFDDDHTKFYPTMHYAKEPMFVKHEVLKDQVP